MRSSKPVVGENFFDRAEILELLKKRLEGLKSGYRQNLALLGPEFVGKTSLALQFLSELKRDSVVPVYIEITAEPFFLLVRRFLSDLVYGALSETRMEEREDLFAVGRKVFPKTFEVIRKIEKSIEQGVSNTAYGDLLDLTALLREESNKMCMVVFDEFQNLALFGLDNPFGVLARKIMVQKDTFYLLMSSAVDKAKELFSSELSVLFGNFELVNITSFDYETSCSFLNKRLAGMDVSNGLDRYLVHLCQGLPFYLDVLTRELKQVCLERGKTTVDEDLIVETILNVVFEPRGEIYQYFSDITQPILSLENGTASACLGIISVICNGRVNLSNLPRVLNRTSVELNVPIQRLAELGMIVKNGPFLRIPSSLLYLWFKLTYQAKDGMMSSVPQVRAEALRMELKRDFENFLTKGKQNWRERLESFLNSFRNERVEIDGKVCLLPHFHGVECRRVNDGYRFIARGNNRSWAIEVFTVPVTENNVCEFIQRNKKARQRFQKKILMSLGGIEMNANLLAKQEGIWVWEKPVLNSVLELYSIPTW